MGLRKHTETIVVAAVTALVVGSAPVLASTIVGFARNAGHVNHKRAVGAKASISHRKGKLVATSKKTGLLPSDIISKHAFAPASATHDAWGFVVGSASNTYFFVKSNSVKGVTREAVGQYCVLVPKKLHLNYAATVATISYPAGHDIVSVGTGNGSLCNPLNTDTIVAIPIYIVKPDGTADDSWFTFYVPAP